MVFNIFVSGREKTHLIYVDKKSHPERKVSSRRGVYPELREALGAAVIVV